MYESTMPRGDDLLAISERRKRLVINRSKLKQASNTSALLSGFAIVAMVELDLPQGDPYEGHATVIAFAAVTVALIVVHLFALLVATSVVPYVDSQLFDLEQLEARLRYDRRPDSMYAHEGFDVAGVQLSPPLPRRDEPAAAGNAQVAITIDTTDNKSGDAVSSASGPDEGLHHASSTSKALAKVQQHLFSHFEVYVEMAWLLSTAIGIILLLVDLVLLGYIKFWAHTEWAGWTILIVIVPASVCFVVFSFRFYHQILRVHAHALQAESQALARPPSNLHVPPRSLSVDDATRFTHANYRMLGLGSSRNSSPHGSQPPSPPPGHLPESWHSARSLSLESRI